MQRETLEVLDLQITWMNQDLTIEAEADKRAELQRRIDLSEEKKDVTAARLEASVRKAREAITNAEGRLADLQNMKANVVAELRAIG